MKKFIGIFTIIILLISCSEEKRNIKDFYFPFDELSGEGKVYEYQSVQGKKDPPFYWHVKKVESDSGKFLEIMYYDYKFELFQFIREEIVSDGILLNKLIFFSKDSLGNKREIPLEVKYGNVFPFEIIDTSTTYVFNTKLKYPDDPGRETTLIKNRRYVRDTTYIYKGVEKKCVEFSVRELIDDYKDGHLEQEFKTTEFYAKGIGLIYFRQNIDESFIPEYELSDIYEYDDFLQARDIILEK